MQYHKTTEEIKKLLTDNNYWFETFEHAPVRTSEEAAKTRKRYTLEQGAKAIIIRVKILGGGKKFVMLVIPGNLRFDNYKVKQLFNAKDIRFATEGEVSELTGGILPGGVPPFGNLFNLEVVVDPKLMENEKIVFNAGDRCYSIAMKSEDYKKIVNMKITEIT